MKRKTQMLLFSVLMFGAQGAMSANTQPYPMDAEASFDLPALQTYADRHPGGGVSDANWGVSKRDQPVDPFMEASGTMGHGPFPSKGGPIDD
jgi:hypothetical protein